MVNSFTDELTAWSWGAQVFGCRKKMSAIAILDYGGANELFHQMSALAKKGRVDYMLYYNEDESNVLPEMDPMVCLFLFLLLHIVLMLRNQGVENPWHICI